MYSAPSTAGLCQHLNSSFSLVNKVDHVTWSISCALTHTHTHHAALESACPTAEGTGFCPVWVCPTTGSPSYGKGSTGSAIKDQRTTHRMHHHDAPCSSTQLNHSFQDGRNPFEQEVAGSLDDALKQLLSKK